MSEEIGESEKGSQKEDAEYASALKAIESSSSSSVVTNPRLPDNPIVLVNDAFCQLTGYAREEIIGRNCRFLQGSETQKEAVTLLREAVRRGEAGATTLRNYGKDGRSFLNCVQIVPIRSSDGELLFFVGSQFEVTPLESLSPMAPGGALLDA